MICRILGLCTYNTITNQQPIKQHVKTENIIQPAKQPIISKPIDIPRKIKTPKKIDF